MALDKLVDSAQLDSDLASVANAIRTKGGTSAQLAFPAGFVSAVQAIPSGGGDPNENLLKLAKDTLTSVDIDMSNANVKERLLNSAKAVLHVRIRNMGRSSGQYICYNCTNLETAVLSGSGSVPSFTFNTCSNLIAVDIDGMAFGNGSVFYNATKLSAVIIRNSTVAVLGNTNAFAGTPFASGKSGGVLYVPSALISSYQSATNWSTILGYANNSIQAIEGSQYENYYADGTPISAT